MATDDKTPDPNNPEGTVPGGGSAETPQQGAPDQQAYTQGATYSQGAYVQDPNAAQNPYGQSPAQNPYSQGQPQGGDNQGAQAAGAYTQGAYTQGAYTPGAPQDAHNQAPQAAYTQGAQQPGAYNQGAPQAGYPQGATPAGYPPAAQRTPMDPKKKKKIILISAIAAGLVLLLIIGSIVINVVGSTQYGPEAKVKAYLSAISKGDASEANKLVEPGVTKDAAALLTDDILGESKALMKNAKVTNVTTRGDSAYAEISYSIDGTAFDGSIELSKDGKQAVFFDNWKIDKPLLSSIAVFSNRGTIVAVNGKDVDFGKESQLVAYPALYEAGAPEGDFFEAETQEIAAGTGTKGGYQSINLDFAPTDQLTKAVQDALNKHLDKCATATTDNPDGCGINFYIGSYFRDEPVVKYKVDTYPVVTVNESGSRFTTKGGKVSISATGTKYGGETGTATDSTRSTWSLYGDVMIEGDDVTIEIP